PDMATGEDGEFRWPGLCDGTYDFRARSAATGGAVKEFVHPGARLSLQLGKASVVVRPVEGAAAPTTPTSYFLLGPEADPGWNDRPDGEPLSLSLMPGDYHALVRTEGGHGCTRFSAEPGASAIGTVVLLPWASLGGAVIGPDGPVKDGMVTLAVEGEEGSDCGNDSRVPTEAVRRSMTDRGGRFAFDH